MFIIKRGANTVLKRIPEQVPQETGMQQSKREIRPDGHLQATKRESGESSKWRLWPKECNENHDCGTIVKDSPTKSCWVAGQWLFLVEVSPSVEISFVCHQFLNASVYQFSANQSIQSHFQVFELSFEVSAWCTTFIFHLHFHFIRTVLTND